MSAAGHGKRDVNELLQASLAGGSTFTQAAELAGVSKSTVQRRMSDPGFRAAVHAERDELVSSLRGRLLLGADRAAELLARLAETAKSEQVQLGAARTILELALDRRHRYDQMGLAEVQGLVEQILEMARHRMPEDEFLAFVRDVAASAS